MAPSQGLGLHSFQIYQKGGLIPTPAYGLMASVMEQNLTWEEIKKNYPDEWVAIGNPQGDLSLPYGSISGEVLAHEHDEKIFTQLLKHLANPNPVDIRYTGDLLPDNPVGPILWQISDTNS